MIRAILGGTFDPIHWGHLRPAQQVQQLLQAQLHLMPSAQPPHRDYPGATATQRLTMAQLAATALDHCVAEDWELNQARPSYTAQTLAELKQRWPQGALVFLCGADAFASLHRWHQWQHLFDHANWVVMQRPHSQVTFNATVTKVLAERQITQLDQFIQQPQGAIYLAPTTAIDISATAIRTAIQQQQAWQHWVPASVADYIEQQQLYR